MKIILFGGSFDPIHQGHVALAKCALEQIQADALWMIPVLNNPFGKQRCEMIEIATRKIDKIKVCDIELKQDPHKKSYTYDTIMTLKHLYPLDDFYYMVGMDQVEKFHLWYQHDALSQEVQLLAFDRLGYDTDHENLSRFHFLKLEIEPRDDASSAIRLGHLEYLDREVLRYISKEGLYLETMIQPWMSKRRYQHTLSMAKLACEFAQSNGVDPQKTYIAGLLHDVAKELDHEQALSWMKQYYPEHLEEPYPVWHQWLSSYVARNRFLVEDYEILKAIEDHTTASLTMTKMGMCIYCADKYDPSRDYDASKEIALCRENIVEGFKQCLKDFYQFSKKKKREITPIFFEIYNHYVLEDQHE